jgi:putative membrane protein
MMMWWSGYGHMHSGGWIGMGLMIVFWIAVVIAIVYLIRHLASRQSGGAGYGGPAAPPSYWQAPGPQGGAQGRSDALRILEERYARGEIEQEEFLKRKADLTA